MFRRLWAAAALLVAACFSTPALAADPTCTSLPFVQGGTTYNECTYNDGTRFYPGMLHFGWTGSAPKVWTMDANGYGGINVFSSVLPTGAATSALQTTGNGYLSTLATGALTKVDGNGYQYVTVSNPGSGGSGSAPAAVDGAAQAAGATVSPMAGKGSDGKTHALLTDASGNLAANVLTLPPVTVGSSALPTGAATATGVAAVVTALGTPLQAGGSVSVSNFPATQPISAAALPLPTGAATAAGVATVAANTKPVTSFGAVTVGTAVTPGIGIAAVCTASGNIVLAGSDNSTITVPVNVGFNQFGFAVAKVVSQTATCTFTALL